MVRQIWWLQILRRLWATELKSSLKTKVCLKTNVKERKVMECGRHGEMVQLVKYLPYKHGNLGLDSVLVWFNVIVIKY